MEITEGDELVAEGKTKCVIRVFDEPGMAVIQSRDDITGGDGAKHDIIPEKGAWANRTTCNVFQLLKEHGVPVAFDHLLDTTSFLAPLCSMLSYEVVVRREAHGSYCKRHPDVVKGTVFPDLVVEFFLKTNGRVWKGNQLPTDDPLMEHHLGRNTKSIYLHHPSEPFDTDNHFLQGFAFELLGNPDDSDYFDQMKEIARKTFLILEKAWKNVGGTLVDFKVEFGLDQEGNLLLADVIDNDSWRVVMDEGYIDKQLYRDNAPLDKVAASYRRVADLTDQFGK